jgi:hypothetical protein
MANDDKKISLAALRTYVANVTGQKSYALADKNLPGCKN